MKYRNKIFVIIFGLIFFTIPIISFIVEKPETIPTQNRASVEIADFSLATYRDGTFQTSLEEGLKDEIIGTNKLRDIYYNMNVDLNFKISTAFSKVTNRDYVILNNGFYYDSKNDFYNRFNRFNNDGGCVLQAPGVLTQMEKYIADSGVESDNVYTFLLDRRRQIDNVTNEFFYDATSVDTLNKCSDTYVDKYKNIHQVATQDSYEDVLNYMIPTDNHWGAKGNEKGYKDIEEVLYNDNVIKNRYVVDEDFDMYEFDFVGSLVTRSFLKEPSYIDKNLKYKNLDGSDVDLNMNFSIYNPQTLQLSYSEDTTYRDFEWQPFQENRTAYEEIINVSTNREDLPNVLMIGDSYDDRLYNNIALNFNNTTVLSTLYDDQIILNIDDFSKQYGIEYDYIIITSLTPVE